MSKNNDLYFSLKELINSGKYLPGDKFLSENQICTKFDVSRNTVRNVLKKIESENLLFSRHGMGYFINDNKYWSKGNSWNLKNIGHRDTKTFLYEKELDKYFVDHLFLNPNDFYCFLKIKENDKNVHLYSYIWINKKILGFLDIEDISFSTLTAIRKKDSFDYSMNVFKMDSIDQKDIEILNLTENTKIPIKYSVIQNKDLEIIQCSLERYKPEFFEYHFIQNL